MSAFDYGALALPDPVQGALDELLRHLSRYPGKETPIRAGYVRRWVRQMARDIARARPEPSNDPNPFPGDLPPSGDVLDASGGGQGPSLLRYLARHGGLAQHGDLRAMDAHRKFVPGAGMLVRTSGGRSLDYARTAAAEMGYLRPDGDINDLLDAINEELHGRPVWAHGYSDARFSADIPF